jgi:PAS domain S-box-containing protein
VVVTMLPSFQLAFDSIIRSSNDAIVTKTLDGTITSWNPGAERVFGYSAEEAVGRPITILFPPDLLDEEKDFLARISRGEFVEHFETIRVRTTS